MPILIYIFLLGSIPTLLWVIFSSFTGFFKAKADCENRKGATKDLEMILEGLSFCLGLFLLLCNLSLLVCMVCLS